MRELFRLEVEEIAQAPLDVVINARYELAEASLEELRVDFRRCLRRAVERLGWPSGFSRGTSGGSRR